MTTLRHTVTQLVDPERQHTGLFQFTVELAELLCKLLALVGDIGALGRCILGRRGAELLQALLRLAGAGFEFIDLGAQRVRRRVECLSKTGQRFGSDLVAADRRFDLIQRGLDRLERGRFGGLGPRGLIERRARSEKRARYGPKNECRPIASHVRLIVMSASPPGGEFHRSATAGSGYAFASELSPILWRAAGARSALIPSRPASKTLNGHENHDRPDRQLR